MSFNPDRPPTEFEDKIYALILTIPRGKVATYKMVARAIGCGSCQAVGQALKRNPFAPRVPCHRIIASDLSIGGFAKWKDPRLGVRLRFRGHQALGCRHGGSYGDPHWAWRLGQLAGVLRGRQNLGFRQRRSDRPNLEHGNANRSIHPEGSS